ncbi:hypothetical protein Moror_11194 [Moniliophthora roreri MCA 2997]|uniref:Uncharacterized protein n=1 Tax=Moniliophthora roreri (strain MCA 2997) TaxID=1381753 RepID=V2WM78_MONRO|nr:hypothetical protein Moror_11194 [Moniliophthora roreri MCA 2997]
MGISTTKLFVRSSLAALCFSVLINTDGTFSLSPEVRSVLLADNVNDFPVLNLVEDEKGGMVLLEMGLYKDLVCCTSIAEPNEGPLLQPFSAGQPMQDLNSVVVFKERLAEPNCTHDLFEIPELSSSQPSLQYNVDASSLPPQLPYTDALPQLPYADMSSLLPQLPHTGMLLQLPYSDASSLLPQLPRTDTLSLPPQLPPTQASVLSASRATSSIEAANSNVLSSSPPLLPEAPGLISRSRHSFNNEPILISLIDSKDFHHACDIRGLDVQAAM